MFDTHEGVKNVTEDVLSAPWQAVEVRRVCSSCCCRGSPGKRRQVRAWFVLQVMVFPELAFRHEGYLSALEFVTQELHQPVQVKFQVHRPIDGEGEVSPLNTCGIVRADAIRAMSNCMFVAFLWPLCLQSRSFEALKAQVILLYFLRTLKYKVCRYGWTA